MHYTMGHTTLLWLACIILATTGCMSLPQSATAPEIATPPDTIVLQPTTPPLTEPLPLSTGAIFVELLPTEIPFWSGPPPSGPISIDLPPEPTDSGVLGDAEDRYSQGFVLYQEGQWDDAIDYFDQAIALNPRHATAYNDRGTSYRSIATMELGTYITNLDNSIEDFMQAISADPTWYLPYLNLGISYERLAGIEPVRDYRDEWYAMALTVYQQAERQSEPGTQPELHKKLASAYARVDQCAAAAAQMELIQSSPLYEEGLVEVALCYKDYDEVLRLTNVLLERNPDSASWHWFRGDHYTFLEQYDQAHDDYQQAIALWRGDFVPGLLWFRLADVAYHQDDYELAQSYVVQGIPSTWAYWGEPYYYLGMIAKQQGDLQLARTYLQLAERTLEEGKTLNSTRVELEQLTVQS